jgi:hypothetical protein
MLHYRESIVKVVLVQLSLQVLDTSDTSARHMRLASNTKEVLMARYLAFSLVFLGITGCTSVHYNEVDCGTLPSDTFWSGNIALQCQEYRRLQAETAYRAEVAQSLKSYRECVAKQGGSLTGAKEQCSVHIQGLRDSPNVSPNVSPPK